MTKPRKTPRLGKHERRRLLERHMARTGLAVDAEVADEWALIICGKMHADPGAAADLMEMTGVIHPDGPDRVRLNIKSRRPGSGEMFPRPDVLT